MKILVVSNMYPDEAHPTYGIFVKKFCDQLESLNISFDISVMLKSDAILQKIVRYIAFYLFTFFKILFHNYDIIYIHYASHSGVPVIIASKLKKIAIYTNVHGSDVAPENQKQAKMQKVTIKLLEISDKIIVPSQYFKTYVSEKYKICSDKIFVYPSAGVNKNVFHVFDKKIVDAEKSKYKINRNLLTFGMAGRISVGKGWDTFVEAIKRVKEAGYEANYLIAGSGPEDVVLSKQIKDLDLENDIIRIPLQPQSKLAMYYSVLDFFVFPTRREGESLGLVAVEAMACGIPVISSDFAAPQYYVKNGFNGFKFKVNDANSLAQCIISRIKNNQNYFDLVSGSQLTAEEYSSENAKKILKNIICDGIQL